MKRIKMITLGLSLLASSAVFADSNHMDMKNMNMHGMNKSMDMKNMPSDSMKPYHHTLMSNGYKVMFSSKKPLMDDENHMKVTIMKDGKAVKDADVNIMFSMPSMPGMEFMTHANQSNSGYDANVEFSMMGHWAYEIMFKTSEGGTQKVNGSINLK